MNLRQLFLTLIIINYTLSFSSQSANNTDFYLKILNAADEKLYAGEIDDAIKLYSSIKIDANKVKNDSILAEALNAIGTIYSIRGQEDSTIKYTNQILALDNPPKTVLIDVYTHFGGILRNEHDHDSSIAYFKKASNLIRENKKLDSLLYASNLLEICTCFLNMYEGDSALTYSFEAIKYIDQNKTSPGNAYAYARIAEIFKHTHNFDKAREYAQKSITTASKLTFNEPKIRAELMMADIEYIDDNFAIALQHLENARVINNGNKNRINIKIDIAYLKSRLSLSKKLTDEEIDQLINMKNVTQDSYDLDTIDLILLRATSSELTFDEFSNQWERLWKELKADNIRHYQNILLNLKYDILKKNKKWQEATLVKEKLDLSERHYLLEKQNYIIHELESRYQKTEQDNKIELLDKQNELQAMKIGGKNKLLIGGAVALGLISLLALILFKSRKTISSQKEKISKSLDEKDTLLREIHHRVKNNLQVISSLLRLQSITTDDEVAIEALKEGQNRVQSMSLIHQNLYQKENLTGIRMSVYLERLCENLFNTYNVSKEKIALETDIEDLNLDVDSVVPLGLIINELITNSLKYAFPDNASGSIKVSLHEISRKLRLIVSDNGIGISSMEEMGSTNSFGHRLITSFSRKLEAEVNISSDNGTTVEILITEYKKTTN